MIYLKSILNEIKNQSSTDSKKLYNLLNKKFGNDIKIERPTDPLLETIEVRFKDLPKSFEKFIQSNNWYISKHHSNLLEVRPIYSSGVLEKDKIPKKLYHTTPTENLGSIMKKGLTSKSMDLRHKYPNRIYLSKSLPMIKSLAKELKHYKKGSFSILEIDSKGVIGNLYNDLTDAHFGSYYVQDVKIQPKYIKVIEKDI